MSLLFDESGEDLGDINLLNACEAYSRKQNDKPVICIFDRDNTTVIKKLEAKTEHGKKYQNWGNGVYSLLIPIPQHRNGYGNICTEMYYSNENLSLVDSSGKRLFFDNEVRKVIFPGNNITYEVIEVDVTNELNKKVCGTDVEKIVDKDGNHCGISKTAFATKIFNEEIPFNNIDFSNFTLVFDVLREILEHHYSQM